MKRDTYLNRIQNLIFGKTTIRFEEKLMLLTSLMISVILFVGTVFNVLLNLNSIIIFGTSIGCVYFLCLYVFGRYAQRTKVVFLTVSIATLAFLDFLWLINYGSNGPMLTTLVIYYSFVILMFDKRYFAVISIVLFVNLLGMYLVETRFPGMIGNYPDQNSKVNDLYISMIFSLVAIFTFTYAIKKNYIKEFERAKKSDQLKSSFLANMSHEIRTPLNAIVGFSSLMSDPAISEEDKKLFEGQIQRNSDYLLRLIEDIIDVSKIESNQLSVKVQYFDSIPVINQILQSFQLIVQSTEKLKVVSVMKTPIFKIRFDALRFEQIIRNLLSNAVKFTAEGQIEVGCRKDPDFVTFWVKDSGIGIHVEDQRIIFDRFIKIENDKQHLYRGTGIGLFISKQLVEMFGGKIWVESVLGKGSTFYFTIPV